MSAERGGSLFGGISVPRGADVHLRASMAWAQRSLHCW